MNEEEVGRCDCCGKYVKEEDLKTFVKETDLKTFVTELWCIDCAFDCT